MLLLSSWRTGMAMVKSATASGSLCLVPQCTLAWVLLPTLAANLRGRFARQVPGSCQARFVLLLRTCVEE